MAYVGIQGGEQAIAAASEALDFLRTRQGLQGGRPLDLASIEHQLHELHGRVLSEGGLYDPTLASLAIKQSCGDSLEASFLLRAYRSTRPRLHETTPHETTDLRLIRRISATFKDVPGGQHLGATRDYTQRLFHFDLVDESHEDFQRAARSWLRSLPTDIAQPLSFPRVCDHLRSEGLLPSWRAAEEPFDITREALVFPVSRSASLATLARGETGGVLALAYSTMRAYGDLHPAIAELRVGYLPVQVPHPITGAAIEAGEVLLTECEVLSMHDQLDDDGQARFGLGYGCCFGHNEHKAIAMAMLDRSLSLGQECGHDHPAADQEFVLLHIDGIDSMGFCNHYKLPHYVTFGSTLDRMRHTGRSTATTACTPNTKTRGDQ